VFEAAVDRLDGARCCARLVVTRRADAAGHICFAGISPTPPDAPGKVIRVHPARHDPLAEMGAFAVPHGRPRRAKPAPGTTDAVKAKPLPGPAPAPGLAQVRTAEKYRRPQDARQASTSRNSASFHAGLQGTLRAGRG
jgi:hypothetical protein